jgi:hypothetical protein
MAAKLKLIPGSTIRWGARRFVVVDYIGLDAGSISRQNNPMSPLSLRKFGLSPVDAAAIPKQSKCRAVGQRRFSLFSLFERNVISR